jgi:NAD/NADP transhydrogenase beta subunit
MFIVAGILFLTSMGDPGKLATARAAVIWAVVGVVVAIIAFSIINIVGGWFGGPAK